MNMAEAGHEAGEGPVAWKGLRVSPDGTRVLAWGGLTTSEARVHVFDLRGRADRMLTSAGSAWAAWTPDGNRVVFNHRAADGKSSWNLYWKSADGAGQEERLTTSANLQQPLFVTPDDVLVYQEEAVGTTGYDLWMLPLQGNRQPKPVRRTQANEYLATFLPEKRYLAYVSDESGREEVWVCRLSDCESPTQVSTDGGTGPLWAPDGRSLFYRDTAGTRLFEVPVTWGATPSFGARFVLSGRWVEDSPYGRNYDIMPDGKRLVLMAVSATAGNELTVVLNWFDELKQKMGAK